MSRSVSEAEAVLRRWFGYPAFRPAQRRVIAAVLRGRDTLAVLPTGGGKSLCFQVPALMFDGLTVVLSPLVSLMKDQVDTLVRRGIPAVGLHGGMSPGEQADAIVRVVRGDARLLYVAPERLVAGRTIEALRRRSVALLAVDEAHCISEWGHDFRPAYRELQAIRAPLGDPPAVALTATATPDVGADIARVCGLRDPVRIVAGFDRPNLHYAVTPVRRARDRDARLQELVAHRAGATVVYAQTRARVERVAAELRRAGVPAVPYHAGQEPELRRRTQDGFMRGDADVIVATSAFGMGVDKASVRLVVHDAMSASLEAYYQEAGRAGRDGAPARCVLLYSRADRRSPDHSIGAASPSVSLVSRVYAVAVAQAGGRAHGAAWIDESAVARAARSSPAGVAGCLAILQRAGAVVRERGDVGRVWVRLIGCDSRIAEACASEPQRLDLLRALWRASGGEIRRGATVSLAALPPGLGAVAVSETLDALQRAALVIWERPQAGLRLGDPSRPLRAWGVDWDAIALRRSTAERRLGAMVAYAETRQCRRRALLGYFGEVAPLRCGRCDRCV